jgi:thioredoxin 1
MSELVIDLTTLDAVHATIAAHPVVVIRCWGPGCFPCTRYAPEFARAADRLSASSVATFYCAAVNVHEVPDFAMALGMRSIPTTLVYRGGQLVAQFSGYHSADDVVARVLAVA